MKLSELAGRRVAVWGFGTEGRSSLRVLQARFPGQPVTVINDTELPVSIASELKQQRGVQLLQGREALAQVADFEILLKSPGISPHLGPSADALAAARAAGTRVTSATDLWFGEFPDARSIAITGTKGKSTTAALVAHLLRAAGKQVALGGNIGTAMLDFVADPPVVAPDFWVLELSSFQVCDLEARPSVAVLLNLYPEHLDWHGTVERYFSDKVRLVQPSSSGERPERVILNASDAETGKRLGDTVKADYFNQENDLHVADGWIREGERPLLEVAAVGLAGAHNLSNVCAALAAVRAVGVDPVTVAPAVRDFRGLPHRLAVLGEREGVTWVDDSISTTPQSAIAAVEAFAGQPVTLLLGGHDRGLDYSELARFVVSRPVERVISLPDSGPRIAEAILKARGEGSLPRVTEASDLSAAVEEARSSTPADGVVLLSPAAPSFGRFRNYQERGKRFAQEVGFGS